MIRHGPRIDLAHARSGLMPNMRRMFSHKNINKSSQIGRKKCLKMLHSNQKIKSWFQASQTKSQSAGVVHQLDAKTWKRMFSHQMSAQSSSQLNLDLFPPCRETPNKSKCNKPRADQLETWTTTFRCQNMEKNVFAPNVSSILQPTDPRFVSSFPWNPKQIKV